MGCAKGVMLVALCSAGCAGSSGLRTGKPPYPPALPHGMVADTMVGSHPVEEREVAAGLIAALRALPDPACCATVRVKAPGGQVLAMATIIGSGAIGDEVLRVWRQDAVQLLMDCLRSIEFRQRPAIAIAGDAAGAIVLASAVLTSGDDGPVDAPPVHRPLTCGGSPPRLFVTVSGVTQREAERILAHAVALYGRRSPTIPVAGAFP